MNILSRLVIKEWFKALLGAVVVLFMLMTTAEVINGFMRGVAFENIMFEYLLKLPELLEKIFPFTCMLATLFALQRLKAHNELIAILAAGLSSFRIYGLIATCSLFMVMVQFANMGYIGPYANKIKRQAISKSKISEGKYLTRGAIDGGDFWFKSKDYFATFSVFDRATNSLRDVKFYFFDGNYLGTKTIIAKEAIFVKENEWLLKQIVSLDKLSVSGFPQEHKTAEGYFPILEKPQDFQEFEADLTTLSFGQLFRFIRKISKTGINTSEYDVLLWQKVSMALACLIFALIPMGSLFSPNRRSDSFGKNVFFALTNTVFFWLLYSSFLSLGNSGKVPAMIAVSTPLLLFVLFVFSVVWRHRKLTV